MTTEFAGRDLVRRDLIKSGQIFDIWNEVYDLGGKAMSQRDPDRYMTLQVARTKAGHAIGNPGEARYLCEHRGIVPELRSDEHSVCSVGYSEKEGKWFGWSHRALSGFGTREQAEKFAESVS